MIVLSNHLCLLTLKTNCEIFRLERFLFSLSIFHQSRLSQPTNVSVIRNEFIVMKVVVKDLSNPVLDLLVLFLI